MIDALRYECARPHHRLDLLDGTARTSALRPHRPGVRDRYPRTSLPPAAATLLLAAGGESLPFSVLGLAVSIIGILSTGHEYRYGTIYPTLTAIPKRSALLAAKVLVVASVSAAAAVTVIAVCWLVGTVTRSDRCRLANKPILSCSPGMSF